MTVSPDFPCAPYADDVRARGWRLEIDYERMLQSDTWALATDAQRGSLLLLLLAAWTQNPCGSLPSQDALIAARIGLSAEAFAGQKAVLLRGWYQANDARMYHPVLTEFVLGMIASRRGEAERKAEYRARKSKTPAGVPEMSHGTTAGLHRESDTGTGTSEPTTSVVGSDQPIADPEQSVSKLDDCPHQQIIGLYAKSLPMLPQPRTWAGQRATNIRGRWRWVLTAKNKNGERCANNAAEALDWFDRFFDYVAESDFLTGRDGKWQACDLAWLVKAENFSKVLEGKYQNREAA